MRSALLCVFFALIIQDGGRAFDSDFRPIPIPLDAWRYERREGRAGTPHELNADAPAADVPAHYWEDALRHSVYLTLVRDKIDQLISRGVVVSPNGKPEQYVSKEIDDHDLWEKIKKAPFDRLMGDDRVSTFGDVTVMAKGRLMEDNGGYRFTEDERSKEDCSDDKCMEGVKAFWSVKRVRQRDLETTSGKYHYELTFSVNSQIPKKQRRPFENQVRTFTVRENAPDAALGKPQEHPVYQPARPQTQRPQRAVWFHKNIAPKNQGRYYTQGLDRIFSSFFSDDDEPPIRYKVNPYPPVPPTHPQYSKNGYSGITMDQHQQKRLMPYPYKPHHVYKYRPPLGPPPVTHVQQHYIDVDVVKHPYVQPQSPDHRYISPSNIVKTTRPAVLPTPPAPIANTTNEFSISPYNKTISEETTRVPDSSMNHTTTVYKTYTKPRPLPGKGNYFPEHIRPPIYNAPPGIFLEKKPFKPMPPLKYSHHGSKHGKRPIDFRPSPQLTVDGYFSSPDSDEESIFRPIIKNQTAGDSMEDIEVTQRPKQSQKRKQNGKKPSKKHENIKWTQEATPVPDIITASNELGDDTIQWADVLGAFSQTTPMHPHHDKKPESTTHMAPASKKEITSSTTEAYEEPTTKATTTTTTPAPKKRTRPPHKFVKPEKAKKHKRITTTTTKAPETLTIKKPSDLTPQASSAGTHSPSWKPKNKTTVVTSTLPASTTTTTTTTTTQVPTTKNPQPTDTTVKTEPVILPTQPKNKNRFRLTTLMQKGTSVKHDRWSTNYTIPENKKASISTTGKNFPRRKGSNFQGYAAHSTSKYSASNEDDGHREKYSHESITSTVPQTTSKQSSFEEIPVHFHVEPTSAYIQKQSESSDEETHEDDDDDERDIQVKPINNYDNESADQVEFIFDSASERTNEIIDEEPIVTEQTVIAKAQAASRNKTKCNKKKKQHHLTPTTTEVYEELEQSTTPPSPPSTKPSPTGMDFLDELIGSLATYEETTEKVTDTKADKELEEEESENHEKYLRFEDDFEELIGNFDRNHRHGHSDEKEDVDYEDEETEETGEAEEAGEAGEAEPFDEATADERARESHDKDYEDYRERPYSILELMAME